MIMMKKKITKKQKKKSKNDESDSDEDPELTEYVITRWYRAQEVILCPSH